MSGLGEGRKGNKPQLAHQSTLIHMYCLVYADFVSSLKSALQGLVMPAPLPKVSPPEEPLPPPRDTESIYGQPPTELHENQPALRVPIPFDASVSNMLDAFCTGIDTNDTNRVILDEQIDDIESMLMPSASIEGFFLAFSRLTVPELPHPSIHDPIIPATPTKLTDLLVARLTNEPTSEIPSLALVVPAKGLKSLIIELNWRYWRPMGRYSRRLSVSQAIRIHRRSYYSRISLPRCPTQPTQKLQRSQRSSSSI